MNTFSMPAGNYYIGDLCYVMDKEWDEVCNMIFANGEAAGKYKLKDGREFGILFTKYGDGCYFNVSRLYSFDVDAGLIGCIKIEDIHQELPSDAVVVTFSEDFKCYDDDGMLVFGHIAIDTAGTADCFESEEFENDD